jgi:NAD(P)-dependent dehydrogenase (short-subunit alcohol dehydrogenase family)
MTQEPSQSYLGTMFGLGGKVTIVTGAAGGIGQVLASGMARAGATTVLSDIEPAKLEPVAAAIAAEGGRAQSYFVDLAKRPSIQDFARQVQRDHGRVDVLVNCAAINKREPILEVEQDTYDRIMNVNLRGLFQLSQAVVPIMPAAGGKIINIGSINSEMGLANVSVYGATKGAVKQITKVMAIEWAARNIQVNCIIPGFMRTPLSAPVWADEKKRAWLSGRIAMQRPGEPEELLGMAIYLASPASSYVTGQSFIIDGGVMAGGSGW